MVRGEPCSTPVTSLIHDIVATPGEVVNVFLAVLMGSFALVLVAPELQGDSLV
jgi:hypothetical protein